MNNRNLCNAMNRNDSSTVPDHLFKTKQSHSEMKILENILYLETNSKSSLDCECCVFGFCFLNFYARTSVAIICTNV